MTGAEAAEIIVIGGGVVGAATARALAVRGASVSLLEAGPLAKAAGSSRGTARIISPAAYPDASYLESGLRAMEEWRRLEAEGDSELLRLDGALLAGSGVEGLAASLAAAEVGHELIDGAEVAARFGIEGLGPGPVLHQFDAGVIRADLARDALLRSAAQAGAEPREHERVLAIDPVDGRVELTTTSTRWTCRRVVVTAGPWTRALVARAGIELPLMVSSQTVAYFRPPERARLPALVEFGDGDEPYALCDPARGLKAALHARGPEVDPDQPWEVVDTAALERIRAWVRSRYCDLDPKPIATEACLYTNSPDERFVVHREGPIVVGAACDGQGFQFAPDTGERLAGIALG